MDKKKILDYIENGPDGKKKLSKDQKRAVFCEKRYIRVLAGAGAGKTETLTRRILYLLLYKEVNPEHIIAFTFTEKAAQSMKSRIYQSIIHIMGEEYAAKLGKMFVGTIHSYALRILQDHFGYGNYEVLDDKQEMAFIMRRGREIGIHKLPDDIGNYGKKCEKFVETVNVIYDEMVDLDKLKRKNPEFYDLFKKYEEKLDEYHRLTFGRIIYLATKKLEEEPEKAPHIEHLIVDEYQDINRAQEKLIQLLGKNASIMVVGDPRQTIYQWRGSDDECFDRFLKHYPDAEPVVIPENRRSGENIVIIGNSVADNFKNRNFERMKPIRNRNGYVYVTIAETPEDEARWIAYQIEHLVKDKGLNYSDIGILLRSVRTSGDPIIHELRMRRIPYVIGGTIGLFRREEASAVGKLFVWLCDDGFWRDYRGHNISHNALVDSALNDWINATGLINRNDIDNIRRKLQSWKNDVLAGKYNSFQEVYHDLLKILLYDRLNPKNSNHATIMANLGRFSNLLGDYENAVRLGGNKLQWNKSNLKGLMWFLNLYATTAYEEQISEDIRGINAVQLITVHQAKGLEWPVVFIPALTDRRFPSSHVGEQRRWLIDRDLFPADRYDTKEDDERRLFYVAVTRAKSTLVLSTFIKIKKKVGRSKFLEEILVQNPKIIKSLSARQNVVIEVDKSFLEATEEEITTYDAQEIIDYTKCPYFFRIRHVWNYDAPLAEEMGYGRALHYCLRRVVELCRKGYNVWSAVKTTVDEDFYLPYAPPKVAKNMKNKAEEMLIEYAEKNIDDIASVTELEYRIEFPENKSTIAGKVDAIIDRNGDVEVREYKTSRKVTKPEQAALQVKLYALGLKALGFNVKKGSVVYLGEGEIDYVDVDEKRLKETKKYAKEIILNLCNQRYNPKPGEFCKVCDYRNICKWAKKWK